MKIGVVGASGYAGGELLRYLANHSRFKPEVITAHSQAGELITALHPSLTHLAGRRFEGLDTNRLNECELIYLALPHGESAKVIKRLRDSVKVVDLGADFRLHDSAAWGKYYGGEYAGIFTYGMPDISSLLPAIKESNRVANPGCYATAIALSAAPAVAHSLIKNTDITVVAASGVSGAGRSAKINLLGSETMNDMSSYKFAGAHQHTPEIEQTLDMVKSSKVKDTKISFTPILAPMPRGILATTTAALITTMTEEEVRSLYQKYYSTSPFVHILEAGTMPHTSAVNGSNNIHIQIGIDSHTNRLIISAAIDNLGKGAAGQAIENANIMMGLDRHDGLKQWGVR